MPSQAYMDGVIRMRWWHQRQRRRAAAGLPWRHQPRTEPARLIRAPAAPGEVTLNCRFDPANFEALMRQLEQPVGQPATFHVHDEAGNEVICPGTLRFVGFESTELVEGVHEVTYTFETVPDERADDQN